MVRLEAATAIASSSSSRRQLERTPRGGAVIDPHTRSRTVGTDQTKDVSSVTRLQETGVEGQYRQLICGQVADSIRGRGTRGDIDRMRGNAVDNSERGTDGQSNARKPTPVSSANQPVVSTSAARSVRPFELRASPSLRTPSTPRARAHQSARIRMTPSTS